MAGNDGHSYTVVANKNGVHRWARSPGGSSAPSSKKTSIPHYTRNYYGLYSDDSGHPNKKAHDEIYRTVVSAKGNAKVVYAVLRKYRKEGADDTATREIVAAQFKTLYKKRLDSAPKKKASAPKKKASTPKKKASAPKTPKKKASKKKASPKKKRVYVDNPTNRRLNRVGKRY